LSNCFQLIVLKIFALQSAQLVLEEETSECRSLF
jgi:hypothetical protein